MGDASSVKLVIADEGAPANYGVNPTGAGNFDTLRFTSESLGIDVGNVQSAEIDATRQPSGNVRTSVSASGGISMEHSLVTPAVVANGTPNDGFDKLIEGAMMSDFSTIIAAPPGSDITIGTPTAGRFTVTDDLSAGDLAGIVVGQWFKMSNFATNGTVYARCVSIDTPDNVLTCDGVRSTGAAVTAETDTTVDLTGSHIRISNTKKSYTIERQYTDLTAPEFTEFLGMRVNRWSMSLNPQAIFTMDFDFLGKIANTTTATTTGGSDIAKWATPRLNAVDHFKQKMLGTAAGAFGVVSADRVLEVSWTLDNKLRTEPELGVQGSTDIGISTPTLEGQIRIYMVDGDLIRAAEDGTLAKLAYRLDDGTRSQIYTFPSILFGRPDAPASGNDQGVIVTLPFFAEPDATDNISFTVDRF